MKNTISKSEQIETVLNAIVERKKKETADDKVKLTAKKILENEFLKKKFNDKEIDVNYVARIVHHAQWNKVYVESWRIFNKIRIKVGKSIREIIKREIKLAKIPKNIDPDEFKHQLEIWLMEGEIYNYADLSENEMKQLREKGLKHYFKTGSHAIDSLKDYKDSGEYRMMSEERNKKLTKPNEDYFNSSILKLFEYLTKFFKKDETKEMIGYLLGDMFKKEYDGDTERIRKRIERILKYNINFSKTINKIS